MKKFIAICALAVIYGCANYRTPRPIVEALDLDDPYSMASIYVKDQKKKSEGVYGEEHRIPGTVYRNRANEATSLEKLAEETGDL